MITMITIGLIAFALLVTYFYAYDSGYCKGRLDEMRRRDFKVTKIEDLRD